MASVIKKNKTVYLILLISTLIFSVQRVFVYSIGYDTALYLWSPETMYNSWYGHERFMLVFLKRLIPSIQSNLHILNAITYFNAFLYSSLFVTFLDLTDKAALDEERTVKHAIRNCFVGLLILTSPFFLEQYYFTLQSAEVSLGFLVISISFFVTWFMLNEAVLWRKLLLGLLDVLLVAFCISMYQYFAIMFIIGFLICMIRIDSNECKTNILGIIQGIVVLAVSLVTYYIADEMVLKILGKPKDSYLGNEWVRMPFNEALTRVVTDIGRAVTGHGHVHNLAFTLSAFFLLYLVLKSKKIISWKTLYYLGLVVTPFLLSLLLANYLLARTSIALSYVSAFVFYIAFDAKTDKLKKTIHPYRILLIFYVIVQFATCQLITFSDNKRYKNDQAIAQKIYEDIGADKDTELYFIGIEETEENIDVFRGEVIGASFFEWGTTPESVNQYALYVFMGNEGYKYKYPSSEMFSVGDKINEEGTITAEYPDEGYFLKVDQGYVVNLGERSITHR